MWYPPFKQYVCLYCMFCLTDKQTKALKHLSEDGTEAGVLTRLSMQRQQIQSEVYHSLQHMRLQKAQLQSSLRELELIGVSCIDSLTMSFQTWLGDNRCVITLINIWFFLVPTINLSRYTFGRSNSALKMSERIYVYIYTDFYSVCLFTLIYSRVKYLRS